LCVAPGSILSDAVGIGVSPRLSFGGVGLATLTNIINLYPSRLWRWRKEWLVMNSQTELINRRELSALLGDLHASTIYRLIAKGILPRPVKIGASSRWLRAEIELALKTLIDGRR
jgi:predicted DNA-binding transcriptional regulator AlpA